MKMNIKIILKILFLTLLLQACATANIARNVGVIAFEETPTDRELKVTGPIEGRDCTWYIVGNALGDEPSVRKAFANTANQSFVPGMDFIKGRSLVAVRNASVQDDKFSLWVFSRSCVVVTGVGVR